MTRDAPSHDGGRLHLFLLLHATATLLDASEKWSSPTVTLIAMGFALTLLLAPRRLHNLTALGYLSLSTAELLSRAPDLANHHNATLYLDLLLLGAIVHAALRLRTGRLPATNDATFDLIAPALRASVVVIYIAAGVHKLNTDFLHPDVSCAGHMIGKFARVWAGLPYDAIALPATLVLILAIGTWIWEIAGGAALAHPRTRHIGVLAMFCLHLLLSLVVFFDFAAIMLATYVAFLPRPGDDDDVAWQRLHTRVRLHLTISLLSAAASGVLHVLLEANPRVGFITQGLLYVISASLVMHAMWPLLKARDPEDAAPAEQKPARWPFAALALLILFSASNYLGLRTAGTFSMFSNLRTEGGVNNHLFLPTLELTDDPDDLVWIERIDSEHGRDHGMWLQGLGLPRVELDKLVIGWRNDGTHSIGARVRDGERVLVTRDLARDWTVTSHPLERALLDFRPVQPDPRSPTACRW